MLMKRGSSPYTDEDVETVRNMARAGKSLAEMSARLGRTTGSVRSFAGTRLGLRFRLGRPMPGDEQVTEER